MIASAFTPSPLSRLATRAFVTIAVVLASLMAASAAAMMLDYAVGIAVFVWIIALTVWRLRYGLYSLFFMVIFFERGALDDPFMDIGWKLETNISSWSPFKFINFAPAELLLIAITLIMAANLIVDRRYPSPAQLFWPLFLFLGLLVVSIGWGVSRGGNLTIASWETRSLFLAGLVAFLLPTVLSKREHVAQLVNIITLAVVALSIETIWRRFVVIGEYDALELGFAHETPVLMDFVVILLLAGLVWPSSRRTRWAALVIPLILYAQMLTERRAGWVGLDVGLILLSIFMFRMRRRWFYVVVLPATVIYVGYLVAFWNAEGPIAQPARAVRSITDPEGRDMNSNLARQLETANVRLNMRANPITGVGFGRQYVDYVGEADLSFWPFWKYMAHNSVMWIWMKMGPLGFIIFLTLIGAGIVRGVQLLKHTTDHSAPLLAALVSGLAMMVVYNYVDLGLTNLRAMAFLGLALGVIGVWGRAASVAGERGQ